MSHVATVDLDVKDLDALATACQRLGLELVRGQTTYRWYGQSVGDYPLPHGFTEQDLGHCEHAIRIPPADAEALKATQRGQEPYEIGICRYKPGTKKDVKLADGRVVQQDVSGNFCLMWDFFGRGFGMQERVGDDCDKLRQQYGIATVERLAQRNGFRLAQQPGANGYAVLTLTR